MPSDLFQGGQRVKVEQPRSELHGKTLIVMAPNAYFDGSTSAVQCFDPQTGYIWPFDAGQLQPVEPPNRVEQ